jgi:general stress protein YciG
MPETASEIKKRARLIRNATPDILEELFKMQNRRCDLCSHSIQDLICATLDHSTPVISFARSEMPIDKAIAQANNPMNLRCVHASCNKAKYRLTREEWYQRGLNKRDAPRILTDGELLLLSFQITRIASMGGRISGRIVGRKTFENKTGVFGRSPEKMSEDGRKGGRIGGCRAHELHPEMAARCGRKNVESGHLASIATPESCAKGGRISGRIVGPKVCHVRWHVNRGISNPACALCQAA